MTRAEQSIYELVGPERLQRLVDVFYAKIEHDASLRQIFPADLEPGKRWQYLFLVQYFGGPASYAAERGHPRLRMRHMPYRIDQNAQIAWLTYMLEAIDEVGIQEPARGVMRQYFEQASAFMVNDMTPQTGQT